MATSSVTCMMLFTGTWRWALGQSLCVDSCCSGSVACGIEVLGVGLQNNRVCKEGASMSACLVQLPRYQRPVFLVTPALCLLFLLRESEQGFIEKESGSLLWQRGTSGMGCPLVAFWFGLPLLTNTACVAHLWVALPGASLAETYASVQKELSIKSSPAIQTRVESSYSQGEGQQQ